jgi:dienelactone hydrolase
MSAARALARRGLLCWIVLSPLAVAAPPVPGEKPQSHTVAQPHDGHPFSYQIEFVEEANAHRLYRIRYPSPVTTAVTENNTVPGDYYVPRGDGTLRRPAVLCLHILHGNFELERITCSTLAAHGIPALMIKLPYYGERSPADSRWRLLTDPQVFLGAMPQGIADVRRGIDVLVSRPEVNPQAVGAIGISLGGIVAATAAAQEPRIARAVLILAGGDLDHIIHHARETRELSQRLRKLAPDVRAEVETALAQVDPLNSAAQLRARAQQGRVLMVNAAEDEVIPPDCTRRLATALGIADRVRWLDGLGHYTALAALPDILAAAVDFFAVDLPPAAHTPSPQTQPGPFQTVMRLLNQASLLLGPDPREGRGHLVDLDADVTSVKGKPFAVRLRLVRGWAGRFRIEAQVPAIGRVALGQGDYPWLLSAGKAVFKGVPAGHSPSDPLALADPQHLVKLRVVAGALSAAGMAPQVLESLATVADDSTPTEKAVRIQAKDARRGSGRLVLKPDGSPARLNFTLRGTQVEIRFRQWQPNTVIPAELFLEPADVATREVPRADLERMFAAMFNLAMESL